MKKIEFYKHNLSSKDINECVRVLKSLFLTTGDQVLDFENKFSTYLNIPYSIGVTSCTDALFLTLRAYGISAGDEVITTPLSFVATANAILYCNAKPIFVDVESDTGNINADLIKKAITGRTKAILVVHLYGQMCDMRSIRNIADKYGLKVIEDAAHCIEGSRDGIRVGELGDASCYSFYATKNITSGEGGAICCHSEKVAQWLKKARLHGMSKNAADRYTKKYEHYDLEFLGYKCNMNNIQASLLINQLERIDKFHKKKEKIARHYDLGFSTNLNVSVPSVLSNSVHARHLYTIWVNPKRRDQIMHSLQDDQVGVAVNFRPIHLMKYYKDTFGYRKGTYPEAEKIGASTISLPFYPKLTANEIRYVIDTVNKLTLNS